MKLNHFYSYYFAIKEIKQSGGKYNSNGWIINDTLHLYQKGLYFLPLIAKVSRSLDVSYNQLRSTKWLPKKIGLHLHIYNNPIEDWSYLNNIVVGGNIYEDLEHFRPSIRIR